ncbi:MAG: hypothetical protein ABTQ34_07340 [Bdellovibrionales bacterium]
MQLEIKQLEIDHREITFYRLKDLIAIDQNAQEKGRYVSWHLLEGDWDQIRKLPKAIVENQGTWCAVVKVGKYLAFVQTIPEVENDDCDYDLTFDFLRITIAKASKLNQHYNACYPQILQPGKRAKLEARCDFSPEDMNGMITTGRLANILEALQRDSWRKLRSGRPNRDDQDTLCDEARGVAALERTGKLPRHRLTRSMRARWTQPSELTS